MPNNHWYTGHASSDKARYIHSINISVNGVNYNTWDDWHLIPSTRPLVVPARQKQYLYDIHGGNGSIDESDTLRNFPLYNDREGSWEFYVENDYGYWQSRYTDIMESVHGLKCIVTLDDDPSWYYTGRVYVNDWKSDKDRSKIVLDYTLYPYKKSWISSTDEDWLWDPFNFETDWIYSKSGDKSLNEITINSTDSWVTYTFTDGYFGREPISPKIILANNSNILVKLNNPELQIQPTDFENGAGIQAVNGTRIAGFTLSNIHKNNVNTVYLKGTGTISFDFRVGRF